MESDGRECRSTAERGASIGGGIREMTRSFPAQSNRHSNGLAWVRCDDGCKKLANTVKWDAVKTERTEGIIGS